MPNRLAIFKVSAAPTVPPTPPAQVRMIRADIVHSMPAVELFGLNAIPFIRSDIVHSMPVKELLSWVGQPPITNPLPDSITVEVSHAF